MDTLMHYNTKIRGIFVEHFSKGFVLGTAFEHYCSWILFMKDTMATQISAMVFHKHKYITNQTSHPRTVS